MHDVYDLRSGGSIFLQQGLDGLSRRCDVDCFEQARSVFVLGVDDEEDGVGGRSRGWLDADQLAEGWGGHCWIGQRAFEVLVGGVKE